MSSLLQEARRPIARFEVSSPETAVGLPNLSPRAAEMLAVLNQHLDLLSVTEPAPLTPDPA